MKRTRLNKKGSFGDLFFILILVTVCAITFVTVWVSMSKVNDEFQAQSEFSTEGKAIMQDSTNNYIEITDGLFLTIMIVLYLGALILAFLVDTHPIFLFASLIVFGVMILIAAVLGNTYETFATTTGISTYADDYTIIPFVMSRLVEIFVVLGMGLAAVMYSRTRV